jgi:hypothetical protein
MRVARRLWIGAVLSALLGLASPARADSVDDAVQMLTRDPAWRVRLQAVLVLGKLNDPRALPALTRALSDPQETVRGVAVQVLSDMNARVALSDIKRLSADKSEFVREKVTQALARLEPPPPAPPSPAQPPAQPSPAQPSLAALPLPKGATHIEVGVVSAKATGAPADLPARLRELMSRELQRTPGLSLNGPPTSGYIVDANITSVGKRSGDKFVEVSCEVSYIVGRLPSKGMLMMTSGAAAVQLPKATFRREFEAGAQRDALEGAMRGAHENLLAFLRKSRVLTTAMSGGSAARRTSN